MGKPIIYLNPFDIMKYLSFLLFFITACSTTNNLILSSMDEYQTEIQAYQTHLNEEYKDSLKSPLTREDRLVFEALEFYKINPAFRVVAKFKEKKSALFAMKTTTDRMPEYRKYGELYFELKGKKFKLNVYQNPSLMTRPGYEDYLFLPFTDPTNGDKTYGGGRYIDFRIPTSTEVILDFNKAYNPYCAYNSKFSCPIPPPENDISVAIEAGVMAWDNY